ncbi:hypothetical protein DB346_11690 [Verrucomicrobia bacterium LW23]|nr:hypothetical protein DB346_11690 [Verrucomicrobia bacterium LW23]
MRSALIILAVFFGSCFALLKMHEANSLAVAAAPVSQGTAGTGTWTKLNFTFRALQDFELQARVLGVARYTSDIEAAVCPVDFALGWGPMARPEVLKHFTISQGNRWYYWESKRPPIPPREVVLHSANMHMIPSTPSIDAKLKSISYGQMIRFSGKLVEVTRTIPAEKGRGSPWRWVSSTSREDMGHGSCEIIYVEKLEVVPESEAAASGEGPALRLSDPVRAAGG